MWSVYLIQHSITGVRYIGRTSNLYQRLLDHQSGHQTATRRTSGEWRFIYIETYRSQFDAIERERKLKQHGSAKRKLYDRLAQSLLED